MIVTTSWANDILHVVCPFAFWTNVFKVIGAKLHVILIFLPAAFTDPHIR